MDHYGHGRSGGKRGCLRSFDQFCFGVKSVVEMARNELGGRKVFLFGHSLGGLIAIQYALRFPESIQGLIVSGAALKLSMEVPPMKIMLGKAASGLLPDLTQPNGIDPADISHDQEVVEEYKRDPLNHDRVSARLFTEMTAAMSNAMKRAGQMTMPLLMIHGGADRLTHPEGTKTFFQAASSLDKMLRIYDGFFHESINEIGKEKAIADILTWIENHL